MQSLRKLAQLAFLILFFQPFLQPVFAEVSRDPSARSAVVKEIRVIGHRKIEEAAIRAKLQTQVGSKFSQDLVRKDVEEIFAMGFFYDIEVLRTPSKKGGVLLTYRIIEKPTIETIDYLGNVEVDEDDLKEASGLKPYEILDHSKIKEAVGKLEKLYEEKGFFLARVSYRIDRSGEDKDQVKLIFDITENDQVVVKRVTFLGNQKIESSKLKMAMVTKEGGFFSFLSGAGAYKQEAFDRDVKVIEFLYYNEGFVQVKVDRPQVYVTPDKKGIYITIRIEEGDQFNVGSVAFEGDLLFPDADFRESIVIDENEYFSREVLIKDLGALQAKYGDLGYAYANIIPQTRVLDSEKKVDVVFRIDKGNKVYFGKINVIGNSRTRDKVLRRELKVLEGELYNETRKRESLENIKRLGYFEEVAFNTKTPRDQPDRMDIDIVVKERNTGTVTVGAGYSSFAGAVFNGQLSQSNFLGRGQSLSASIDFNKRQSLYRISFTEPYFYDTEWSLGFDAYRRQRTLFEYGEVKSGGALRVGHPIAPYLNGFIRYKLDQTDLTLTEDGDPQLFPVETANGITSSMTFSLEYDKRDDRLFPTKGLFSSLSLEYAGLGGDLKYTKGYAAFRYFKKIFWEVVWRNNVNYGFVASNEAGRDIPFNELFLLGGANSLRGYNYFSVGKRKTSQKARAALTGISPEDADYLAQRPFGGTQQFYYNLEFEFPLVKEAGIRGVFFYDIGNADDLIKFEELRSDVGLGFRWRSPIGPLRFEWGFPLDRDIRYGEEPMNFEFSIGSPF